MLPSLSVANLSLRQHLRHGPSWLLRRLRVHRGILICLLLVTTFLAYFYASDLKGIWNDDAVRLTIANGGTPNDNIESRHPGNSSAVIGAIGKYAVQPLYPILVNKILRLTKSYSVIPVVTTNLLIFLLSALGIYPGSTSSSFRAANRCPCSLSLNGFAWSMSYRCEYPLILFLPRP
jgi:hypothetical protein